MERKAVSLPNEEGDYGELKDDFGDYTSPLTEETQLQFSPIKEQKMSPRNEFEMDCMMNINFWWHQITHSLVEHIQHRAHFNQSRTILISFNKFTLLVATVHCPH